MSESKHTPTPWILGPIVGVNGFAIYDANGVERAIANVDLPRDRFGEKPTQADYDERAANAAFIVTACNAHEEFVALLNEFVAAAEMFEIPDSHEVAKARAALAKVSR